MPRSPSPYGPSGGTFKWAADRRGGYLCRPESRRTAGRHTKRTTNMLTKCGRSLWRTGRRLAKRWTRVYPMCSNGCSRMNNSCGFLLENSRVHAGYACVRGRQVWSIIPLPEERSACRPHCARAGAPSRRQPRLCLPPRRAQPGQAHSATR